MKKFISIIMIMLVVILMTSCGARPANNEIVANDGRSIYPVNIYEQEELIYDTNTQIVYIRQNTYYGYSVYTPYFSENGFPYRYVNGEFVEVGK